MSEKLQNNSDNDDLLTPAGFDGNPSLYGEQKIAHDYGQLPTAILDEKVQRFISILNDPNTLPHHRKQYAQLIDLIVFETNCREAERVRFMGAVSLDLANLEVTES